MRAIGKSVRGALYVHAEAVPLLAPDQRRRVAEAGARAAGFEWNVARLERDGPVGLLDYPDFEREAFPRLAAAARVDPGSPTVRITRYDGSANPLILHRKELLVAQAHPGRAEWAALTTSLEGLGLFADTSRIGRFAAWTELLRMAGLDGQGRPA